MNRWRLAVVATAAVVAVAAIAGVALSGDDGSARGSAIGATAGDRDETADPATTTSGPTTTTTPEQALAAGICPAVPPRAGPDPDRPRYRATVDARPVEGVVAGDLAVAFTPDLPTDVLVFRLWANAPRTAAAGVHIEVGSVTVDGAAAPTSRPDPTTLEVSPGRTLAAGETVDVDLSWLMEVPGSVPDRLSRSGGALRLGTLLPVLAWEPGVGWARDPATAGFAEATTSPVSDYTVEVTVPDGYQVLATGVDNGQGTWTAVAVRDFAMTVGRFETASTVVSAPDPVTVTVGVHEGIGESPEAYLDRMSAAVTQFSFLYGAYPWPTLSLAITPGLQGGIEFPTHIMQGPDTLGRTTSHEVGHQWFYALVGNNQARDPVLDEGLASYAEARFEDSLGSFGQRSIPVDATGRAGEPMAYWEDHLRSYYRGVYVQGANAVAALGEPALLDCALAHYVAGHAYGIASQADLVAAMEFVFPDAAATLATFGIG